MDGLMEGDNKVSEGGTQDELDAWVTTMDRQDLKAMEVAAGLNA